MLDNAFTLGNGYGLKLDHVPAVIFMPEKRAYKLDGVLHKRV